MRILHLSTRLIIGGSQENTILSCEGHVQHGHETHLAFGRIYGPEGTMLPRVEAFNAERAKPGGGETGIRTHELSRLVRELDPPKDARCVRDLKRLIESVKPDVVHTHSSKAGILGRGAAWSLLRRGEWRGAVVHTVHGPPFHRYESAWRNRLYVLAERWAAKRCHAIVCVADAMRRQFLEQKIGRAEQYSVIRSGMEVERYVRAPSVNARRGLRERLGFGADDRVIGTIARLSEHKGHDDLIAALAAPMRDDPSLKLLWVGDGWLREQLEDALEREDVRDRVTITGVVPPDEVPELLGAMDVLVHPSYREGLPRTVVQGLLAGVPVAASDADGTPEVIEDGVTGRLFAVGDASGLRAAVLGLLTDRSAAAAMAATGRERCREAFAAERMVEALESLYERVLEGVGEMKAAGGEERSDRRVASHA